MEKRKKEGMERTKKRSLPAVVFAAVAALAISAVCFTSTAWAETSTTCTGGEACSHEAAIGATHYDTLGSAYTAANSGDEIDLLKSIELSNRQGFGKSIILDFNKNTITSSASTAMIIANVNANVTFKNGTLRCTNTTGSSKGIHVQGGAAFINNLRIEMAVPAVLAYNYAIYANTFTGYDGLYETSTVALNGATIAETEDASSPGAVVGVALFGRSAKSQDGSYITSATATVDSTNIEVSGYPITGHGTSHGTSITINSGTLTSTDSSVLYHPQAGKLTVNGGTMTGHTGIQMCAGTGAVTEINNGTIHATGNDERAGKYGGDGLIPDGSAISVVNRDYPGGTPAMTVSGGTFISNNSDAVMAYTWEGETSSESANDAKWAEWEEADEQLKISGGTFSDLSAVEYAADGAEIALSKDASGAGVFVEPGDKDITIDLGGNTYTVTGPAVGSTNTETQGLHLEKGNSVTIKDGTITSAPVATSKVKMLVQNYCDLTLSNVTLDGTNLGDNQYVLSNNCGDVVLTGGTKIMAPESGGKAFDLYYWPSNGYAEGVSVSVENATIDGIIEIGDDGTQESGTLSLSISGGDFSRAHLPNKADIPAFAAVQLTGGTFSGKPNDYVAEGYIVMVDNITEPSKYVVLEKANLTSGYYLSDPTGATAANYYVRSEGNMFEVYYVAPYVPPTTTTETTTNPDGTTTTTETNNSTGTVTETTEKADGSVEVVETKKDGTVTTTVTKTDEETGVKTESSVEVDGTTGVKTETETVTDADGNATETVTVTDEANGFRSETVENADGSFKSVVTQQNVGEADVVITTTEVTADGAIVETVEEVVDGESSVTSTVTVPEGAPEGGIAVTVPVEGGLPDGTVAINADTGEPVKLSVVTEDGVAIVADESLNVVIVDASVEFEDVDEGHWAEGVIDFTSAREIFLGTSPTTFSPEQETTRGMLMTVLCRLADGDHEAAEGELWYGPSVEWAMESGVSNGADPDGVITREQLIAMLWNYAGQPESSHDISGYEDAGGVSPWAEDAMRWAVEVGIMRGVGGELVLDPGGSATRAQLSAFMQRYVTFHVTMM